MLTWTGYLITSVPRMARDTRRINVQHKLIRNYRDVLHDVWVWCLMYGYLSKIIEWKLNNTRSIGHNLSAGCGDFVITPKPWVTCRAMRDDQITGESTHAVRFRSNTAVALLKQWAHQIHIGLIKLRLVLLRDVDGTPTLLCILSASLWTFEPSDTTERMCIICLF